MANKHIKKMLIIVESSGKCIPKPQGHSTTCTLEWLKLKRLAMPCAGKDAGQLEFSRLLVETERRYADLGNQPGS